MLAYLRLCRFPLVFTALADIFVGFLLAHASLQPLSEFLALLTASAGLYLGGMVLNDVFDRAQDAQERPNRPIPSGQITLRRAMLFGCLLMLAGLAFAFLAGRSSFLVAWILVGAIFAYDGVLKRTFLGPVAMGSCRFLNVILGASSASLRFETVWQNPQLWVALSLGTYIVGVTLFAKREATSNTRGPLVGSALLINLGLIGLALWFTGLTSRWGWFHVLGATADPTPVLFVWGVIALTINRRLWMAVLTPEPQQIQRAVGTMLLSIVVVDALVIFFKLGPPGLPYAIGAILLLVPAITLRRWIPLT